MKLSDPSPLPRGAWLLIGVPGSGKTTFLTQCPGIYIFDLDMNMEGPRNTIRALGLSAEAEYDTPFIEGGKIIPRKDWYVRFGDKLDKVLTDPNYPIVGIDGLTALVPMILNEVRRQQGKAIIDPTPGSIKLEFKVDRDNLTLPEWGAFQALLRHLITVCKGSGKLVIFTAHTMTDKDDMKGFLKTYISCPTSIKETLPGMFDEAIKLYKVEEGNPKRPAIKIQTIPRVEEREEALGLKTSLGFQNGDTLDFAKLQQILKR